MPQLGRFIPEKDPVPNVQEAGWAPETVWTGAENLAHTGIRYPGHSLCIESLCQLFYPGPLCSSAKPLDYLKIK